LKRLGRTGESIAWLRDSAACHRDNTSPQGRVAELTALNLLGSHLRERGYAEQALGIHRRSEAICLDGIPGQLPDLIALYHSAVLRHIANDLAALDRWPEAEPLLRQALATFETAGIPSWSEPTRLELGIVLRRLARFEEARTILRTAQRTLGELNSPQQTEAATELHALATAVARAGNSR
jgi:tetratricopeptide (TPR) repeat protein